jgi:hypothetical protein
MYTGLQHLHSGIAYLALLSLIIVIVLMLVGALTGRDFTEKDRKIAMIAFIFAHVQLLVGLILYFVSPLGFSLLTSGEAMSVGYIRAKKMTVSRSRFRSIYMMYAIGLLLILSRIPWANWMA